MSSAGGGGSTVSARSREEWRADGTGRCRGCLELTSTSLLDEHERRVPVCPDCAELARRRPGLRKLLLDPQAAQVF
jgi:hypothetical protein